MTTLHPPEEALNVTDLAPTDHLYISFPKASPARHCRVNDGLHRGGGR